jgi:hypothetical protein
LWGGFVGWFCGVVLWGGFVGGDVGVRSRSTSSCWREQLAGSGLLGAPAGEERRHLGLQEFEERE